MGTRPIEDGEEGGELLFLFSSLFTNSYALFAECSAPNLNFSWRREKVNRQARIAARLVGDDVLELVCTGLLSQRRSAIPAVGMSVVCRKNGDSLSAFTPSFSSPTANSD